MSEIKKFRYIYFFIINKNILSECEWTENIRGHRDGKNMAKNTIAAPATCSIWIRQNKKPTGATGCEPQ